MTPIADLPPVVIVVGVLLVAVLAHVIECRFFPFAKCRRCDGTAKRSRADGQAWRLCARCGGTGRRWRWGSQVWSRWRGRDM